MEIEKRGAGWWGFLPKRLVSYPESVEVCGDHDEGARLRNILLLIE